MKKIKNKKIDIKYQPIETNPEFNSELSNNNEIIEYAESVIQDDTEDFEEVENKEHISGSQLNNNHKKNKQ